MKRPVIRVTLDELRQMVKNNRPVEGEFFFQTNVIKFGENDAQFIIYWDYVKGAFNAQVVFIQHEQNKQVLFVTSAVPNLNYQKFCLLFERLTGITHITGLMPERQHKKQLRLESFLDPVSVVDQRTFCEVAQRIYPYNNKPEP